MKGAENLIIELKAIPETPKTINEILRVTQVNKILSKTHELEAMIKKNKQEIEEAVKQLQNINNTYAQLLYTKDLEGIILDQSSGDVNIENVIDRFRLRFKLIFGWPLDSNINFEEKQILLTNVPLIAEWATSHNDFSRRVLDINKKHQLRCVNSVIAVIFPMFNYRVKLENQSEGGKLTIENLSQQVTGFKHPFGHPHFSEVRSVMQKSSSMCIGNQVFGTMTKQQIYSDLNSYCTYMGSLYTWISRWYNEGGGYSTMPLGNNQPIFNSDNSSDIVADVIERQKEAIAVLTSQPNIPAWIRAGLLQYIRYGEIVTKTLSCAFLTYNLQRDSKGNFARTSLWYQSYTYFLQLIIENKFDYLGKGLSRLYTLYSNEYKQALYIAGLNTEAEETQTYNMQEIIEILNQKETKNEL